MRTVAVCGAGFPALPPHVSTFGAVAIHGVPARVGVVERPEPAFDAADPANARKVLVRVRAFSCNYRDRAQIYKLARFGSASDFYVLGSEFAGEVVAAGPEVTTLRPGDRVMGDNAWPHAPPHGWRAGVPTNHASREYLALREEKVARIPEGMSDAVAASFSIGAQTAYSMVGKLEAGPGSRVLVTAARSNTSLFAIAALRSVGARVFAATTSAGADDRLRALGAEAVFRVDPGESFGDHEEIAALVREGGGFDGVVDPFFDLHLRRVLPVMAQGSRYTTCGFYAQSDGARLPAPAPELAEVLQIAMLRNLHLIGNCTGLTADLERAVGDFAAGRLPVLVDSVLSGDGVAAFFDRTFNAADRLGKVVYAYDGSE